MTLPASAPELWRPWADDAPWTGSGATKGRAHGEGWEFLILEVTSQAKVYKQKLDRLLRTECRVRPRWGEFEVDILIELNRNYPAIDLDNVAKAVLDGIKGAVFFDDAQVMRLVVEKRWAESERLYIRALPRGPEPDGDNWPD
jgi:Holliday junction resolvase RusA-like endonuclease